MKKKVSRFNPWVTWYFEGYNKDLILITKGFRSYKMCVSFAEIEKRLLYEAQETNSKVYSIGITGREQMEAWIVR